MPSKLSRRDVLGLGGAGIALLAGCLGESPGGESTTEPTRRSTEPYGTTEPGTTAERFDVSIEEVAVTPELVAPNSPDSIGVVGGRGEQFVVARYSTEGGTTPDRSDFSLVADDDPFHQRELSSDALWDDEDGWGDVCEGYLVFEVPKPLDADDVAVRWPGGTHALSEDAVERLNRSPTDFAVRQFSAPASVETGREVTLTVVVENVGDADGTFVGALNRIGPEVAYSPEEAVILDLDAGASTTWTYSHSPSTAETRPMRLTLDWRDGDRSHRTQVVAGSPTETTRT